MKLIITGKADSHHSRVKPGFPSHIFWTAYRNISSERSVFKTKAELIKCVIKPAFDASGLRKAKADKRKYYARLADYLIKDGCIIEI